MALSRLIGRTTGNGGLFWVKQSRMTSPSPGIGRRTNGLKQIGARPVLQSNLYKLWNRMSSDSYFPPPVKRVQIDKRDGGKRPLGIPTV
ncbi:hypothetical protein ACVIHI_000160 [Bradyrhizobium sp. USDA 4524]|nr:hypothetical protein [Bradyrhizobium sp. USDA 4538]MCP1899037.1 hypothetical protein [Bradyrhizobium sp. USDA 4537]MCP1986850.1 hypothetical protein [Bradyrhizobium sp. USDA 4539]